MTQFEDKILNLLMVHTAPTGSRFWSSIDPDLIQISEWSDYDFVVCEGDPIIEKATLIAEAFGIQVKQFSKYDLDPSTERVICYGEQVQLIVKYKEWYSAYMSVQATGTPTFYHNFLWKRNNISVDDVRDRLIMLMSFFLKDLKVCKNATDEEIVSFPALLDV